ncbi:hypothetical protein, partial [Algoriphagus aquimarinus]|uniref:hypothetical protein n=1 Tax=Algoriphagus aquimarinus TaxID=237018 RepID=UPI0030DCD53B
FSKENGLDQFPQLLGLIRNYEDFGGIDHKKTCKEFLYRFFMKWLILTVWMVNILFFSVLNQYPI